MLIRCLWMETFPFLSCNWLQSTMNFKRTLFFIFCRFFIYLQGVPKKIITLRFASYFKNQGTDLQTACFCWKLISICKFWIQNHFCAITGAWYISRTKRQFLKNEILIDYWNLVSNAKVYRKINNMNFNWKLCVQLGNRKASQGHFGYIRASQGQSLTREGS